MLKTAFAIGLIILCGAACAETDDYYECLKPEGFTEYSIYPCEDGQQQTYVGGKETPKVEIRKKALPTPRRIPRPEPKPAGESNSAKDYNLASYKCVGKSGNILYTDARDYLAFETHRCRQISLSDACGEVQVLKAKDPLAIVSNKLSCP
jgi:hypothetical protein